MSANDEQTGTDEETRTTEAPEPTDEHWEKAKEMAKAYEDRPTAVLPGADRTITGTAVNEWLDDEGNPKFGKDEEGAPKEQDTSKEQDTPKEEDAAEE